MAQTTFTFVIKEEGGGGSGKPSGEPSKPSGSGPSSGKPKKAPPKLDDPTKRPKKPPKPPPFPEVKPPPVQEGTRQKLIEDAKKGFQSGGVIGGIKAIIGKAGPAALAVAGLAAVAASTLALVKVNSLLLTHFKQRADQLRPFSGAIGVQQAQSQISQLRLDIQQARELGPAIARFNAAEDKLFREVSKIIGFLEGRLLEDLTPLIESVGVIAGFVAENADVIGGALRSAVGGTSPTLDMLSKIAGAMFDLAKTSKDNKDQAEIDKMAIDIMGMFRDEVLPTVLYKDEQFGETFRTGPNRGATDRFRPSGARVFADPITNAVEIP